MSFRLIPQAFAQSEGINLGDELKLGTNNQSVSDVYQTPGDLVNLAVRNLFPAASIILFFMVIYAGFKFLKDETKAKEEAKKIMKTAITGFIIMFAAYWIIQIIQVITGANIKI